jgi:hypothetical protein
MLQYKPKTHAQRIAENSDAKITNLHILMFGRSFVGRANEVHGVARRLPG